MAPVEKISTLLTGVTSAVLAKMQHDQAAMRRYFRNMTEALCVVALPAAIGIALVSNDLILGLLGSKWAGSITILKVLCVYGAIRSVSTGLMPFVYVLNEVRFGMWHSVISFAVYPVCFYVASAWGGIGLAATWVVVYPLFTLALYWRVMSRIVMPVSELLNAVWPALLACGAMVLGVLLFIRCAPFSSPLIRLVSAVSVGALAYAVVILALRRDRLRACLALFRGAQTPSE